MRFKLLYLIPLFFITTFAFAKPGFCEPWGKDSSLITHESKISTPPPPSSIIGKIAESIILFHQNILSPVDGPRSHFRPTSSRFMLLAIRRYGFLKGYIMGCDRLLRENKEDWVYRKRTINGITYKWDPTYKSRSIDRMPLTFDKDTI